MFKNDKRAVEMRRSSGSHLVCLQRAIPKRASGSPMQRERFRGLHPHLPVLFREFSALQISAGSFFPFATFRQFRSLSFLRARERARMLFQRLSPRYFIYLD